MSVQLRCMAMNGRTGHTEWRDALLDQAWQIALQAVARQAIARVKQQGAGQDAFHRQVQLVQRNRPLDDLDRAVGAGDEPGGQPQARREGLVIQIGE